MNRHSRLRTPGRYGLERCRASTPATPWATTASHSARPSVAMAGTATTSSPGRRTRRSASCRLASGWPSNDRPSIWRRSSARNATARPARPSSRAAIAAGSARPARIDDHDLPVQHRRACVDPHGEPGQLAQVPGEVGAILVHDADNPSAGQLGRADVDQRPPPAPPRLEQVLVRIERLGEGPRQHRPEVGQARQDRLLGLEPERELVGHRRSMVAGQSRVSPIPNDVGGPRRWDGSLAGSLRVRRLEAP